MDWLAITVQVSQFETFTEFVESVFESARVEVEDDMNIKKGADTVDSSKL
ncbi:MAG: hypothetical protein AAF810_24665 [Cyanobacteria bacterium P01_D01_bin.36]